jgi:hypothetical protein
MKKRRPLFKPPPPPRLVRIPVSHIASETNRTLEEEEQGSDNLEAEEAREGAIQASARDLRHARRVQTAEEAEPDASDEDLTSSGEGGNRPVSQGRGNRTHDTVYDVYAECTIVWVGEITKHEREEDAKKKRDDTSSTPMTDSSQISSGEPDASWTPGGEDEEIDRQNNAKKKKKATQKPPLNVKTRVESRFQPPSSSSSDDISVGQLLKDAAAEKLRTEHTNVLQRKRRREGKRQAVQAAAPQAAALQAADEQAAAVIRLAKKQRYKAKMQAKMQKDQPPDEDAPAPAPAV